MNARLLAASAALLLAFGAQAADPQSVSDKLLKATGLKAESVKASPVKGLWEAYVADRIFYVDDEANHVLSGVLIETATQTNLTEVRMREIARDNWSKWPREDAVKQVFGKGEREVIVFSDANCTYCRVMEKTFERVGNLTVHTFIVPMLRGEKNNREIVCSKDPAKAWHDWMGRGIPPATAPLTCDSSVLTRNTHLMNRYRITAAPTLFFPSGEKWTGALQPAQLEQLLARD